MKAKFEICLDEQRDLEVFGYGLQTLIVELGGGTFHKHYDESSNGTVYDYECANDNAWMPMNSVGTLVARHRPIEHMQGHELFSN
jgi:hypothetical protein